LDGNLGIAALLPNYMQHRLGGCGDHPNLHYYRWIVSIPIRTKKKLKKLGKKLWKNYGNVGSLYLSSYEEDGSSITQKR